MDETPDTPLPTRRLQRHQRHPQAGEQRRRLQFGTGYPHRGPAPACEHRQQTYQPIAGDRAAHKGRLRVLNIPRES